MMMHALEVYTSGIGIILLVLLVFFIIDNYIL